MIKVDKDIDTSDVVVKTLGPSTFCNLLNGCRYQYLLSHTNNVAKAAILPNLKAPTIGTIIHSLFEMRIKGEIPDEETFEKYWEEKIRDKEKEIQQTYGLRSYTLTDYDKMYSAMDTALKMPHYGTKNKPDSNSGNSYSFVAIEKPVKTSTLSGKIDKVEKNDTDLIIVDFKTGKVIDENTGQIKEEYVVQLNLYAHMYYAKEGEKATKLEIIDIDGNSYSVPIWSDYELQQTLNDVTDVINDLNSKKGINLAFPSDKCSRCNARMICSAYWNSNYRVAVDPDESNMQFEDMEFEVMSIINKDVIEYNGGRIKGLNRFTNELELGKTYRMRGLIFIGNNFEFGALYTTGEQSFIVELI